MCSANTTFPHTLPKLFGLRVISRRYLNGAFTGPCRFGFCEHRGGFARFKRAAFTPTCSTYSLPCCCCSCSLYEPQPGRHFRTDGVAAAAGTLAQRSHQELEGQASEPSRSAHLAALFRPGQVSAQRHGHFGTRLVGFFSYAV